MARPVVEVEIGSQRLNAILDTGAWRSYIRADLAEAFPVAPVQPFETRLEGETLSIREGRFVSGQVKDSRGRAYQFSGVLFPAPDLGEEDGKRVDVLFGAVILEDWGAVINEGALPPEVDYYRLRKATLTEL